MALTEEQAAAYEKLEAAIDELLRVGEQTAPNEFTVGFVLIVNGAISATADHDCLDELETVGTYHAFTRRGQHPALTRGIVESWCDLLRLPIGD